MYHTTGRRKPAARVAPPRHRRQCRRLRSDDRLAHRHRGGGTPIPRSPLELSQIGEQVSLCPCRRPPAAGVEERGVMKLEVIPWGGTGPPAAPDLRERLEREGFAPFTWSDRHAHDHDESIWVVSGEIAFGVGDRPRFRRETSGGHRTSVAPSCSRSHSAERIWRCPPTPSDQRHLNLPGSWRTLSVHAPFSDPRRGGGRQALRRLRIAFRHGQNARCAGEGERGARVRGCATRQGSPHAAENSGRKTLLPRETRAAGFPLIPGPDASPRRPGSRPAGSRSRTTRSAHGDGRRGPADRGR